MDEIAARQQYVRVPSKPNPVLKAVGARIRSYREDLDWTEERFAAEADLSTTYVSDIELGKRNISLLVFLRIARALRVKPGALLD